jgi:predicted CopG family antitoxin
VQTTLTLDDDVYRRLEAEARRARRSFKAVINEHLRRSLAANQTRPRKAHFEIEARDMGLRSRLGISNIHELLDQLDGAGQWYSCFNPERIIGRS